MTDSRATEIESLRAAMAALEAQRSLLGDAVVETSLDALRHKLAPLEAQAARERAADERRPIAIFFSDVVGSVTLAERLDPEDWRAVIGAVQSKIGSIVTARGGMIAQYQGDALIAFFGARGLREVDVAQAIHAGLEAQAAIPQLQLPVALKIRVGIHTGVVLLGAWGADSKIEFGAFGDAVNVAARLQSHAPPGEVLISNDTYQYVRGVFDVVPRPPLALKGRTNPIETFLVPRAKPRAFRFAERGVPGIQTPTIGRDAELEQLRAAYLEAYERRRVVWTQLVGEPGVGKSRLVQEMNDWVELRPERVIGLRGRAFDGEQNQPFALVRRMWFDRFQIAEDAPLAQAQLHWSERFRELTGIADEEAAHALGLLVGLPFENSPHLIALRHDPNQLRGRVFVTSREALRAMRAKRPLQIMLEDLHWADASSLEYLQRVILPDDEHEVRQPARQGGEPSSADASLQGMFVLGTSRTGWNGLENSRVTTLPLVPLSVRATEQLAHELLKNVAAVPAQVVQLVVERADGVPYFAEELVNYFLDRGIIDRTREPWQFVNARLDELHGSARTPLPATLQYLLRARLDTLSPSERTVLQRGAIYGRHFWSGGVRALGVQDADEILPGLEPRGFVALQPESALADDCEWSFHHALLRDATYESVLKRERPGLHQKAAVWLESKAHDSQRLDEFAGLVGEHYERGGSLNSAAGWYLRAGEHAHRQGAMHEARKFFDRTLELLPPIERELQWRALVGREAALGRLGERELQHADICALVELAQTFDDDECRAQAFYSEARYHVSRGELRSAVSTAERALAAAQRAGKLALQATAMASIITSCTRLGELERARALVREAHRCARASGDDFVHAQTLMQIALHYTDAGDLARAVAPYIEAADIAHRLGNRVLEAQVLSNLGYCYAQLGLYALARPALEKTLELSQAVGERRNYSYGLQNLGWTYLCMGDGQTARQLQEQALHVFTVLGDAFGHAASVLYLGHIAERAGDVTNAARHFGAALEHFVHIGVRGFVLDSTAGVARCAVARGDLPAARQNANELWNEIAAHGAAGMEQPTLAYLTCANVFNTFGTSQAARAVIEAGYRELMQRAEKISEPEWRISFLENVPEHRAMVEMWEQVGGHTAVVSNE